MMKARLGVNIDHVATLRQVRGESYPAPVDVLSILKKRKVDQVTIHLREDRRHIQDDDVKKICAAAVLPVNLEMAATSEMLAVALRLKPATVTYVPEKRQELTTEGGLNVQKTARVLKKHIVALAKIGIRSSLFITPDIRDVEAAKDLGASGVEFHTGTYCRLVEKHQLKTGSYLGWQKGAYSSQIMRELNRLKAAIGCAHKLGLGVYAGHGLNIHNLQSIVSLGGIEEYNIGHAIIARAVFVGLDAAIKEIQNILCGKKSRG